ncbi:Hypothetical_protein [Hexamita inflata]|uniref:Hypothetical_protein n=1 Tax=Hexamita inflata TaxID=28002 RepID=A0ABP1K238_9EUKA
MEYLKLHPLISRFVTHIGTLAKFKMQQSYTCNQFLFNFSTNFKVVMLKSSFKYTTEQLDLEYSIYFERSKQIVVLFASFSKFAIWIQSNAKKAIEQFILQSLIVPLLIKTESVYK